MITQKKIALRPIFESNKGIHLTAYLKNGNDLADLQAQIKETLSEAEDFMNTALPHEELKKFLEPIESLLEDTRILESVKGNIGIFRTKDFFRVLNIPIDLERQCHVANNFHIKPLLRWLQCDHEFFLLGIESDYAHLYQGSQNTIKKIDTIKLSVTELADTISRLNDSLIKLTKNSNPKLFIAGPKILTAKIRLLITYKNTAHDLIFSHFSKETINVICSKIRMTIKESAKINLEESLLEFYFADAENRTKKNIFQISKAVIQGKVKKLIVTDELNIFGKIDAKTGGLAIHPFDLDHEDDCILDDLAQMVLNQGGEVIIAKRNEIPQGRPILAILHDTPEKVIHADDPLRIERVLKDSII